MYKFGGKKQVGKGQVHGLFPLHLMSTRNVLDPTNIIFFI